MNLKGILFFTVLLSIHQLLYSQHYVVTEAEIQAIINDGARLRGITAKIPKVRIEPTERLAFYNCDLEYPKIVICPERVIARLVKKFPKNRIDDALAPILLHELAHYEHHLKKRSKSCNNLGIGFWGVESAENMAQGRKQDELNCDLNGLLTAALLPGCEFALALFPEVYDLILPDKNTPGYPNKQIRQETNVATQHKANEIMNWFDRGAVFMLTASSENDYALARACYERAAQDLAFFPDVNFNIGLGYLLEALTVSQFAYAMPIEITGADFAEKLSKRGTKGPYSNGINVTRQLDSAGVYFRKTLNQNPSFYEAGLGLMCMETLKREGKNADELVSWLNNYEKSQGVKSYSDPQFRKVQVLYAVALKMRDNAGDKQAANKIFKEIGSRKIPDAAASYAQINLNPVAEAEPKIHQWEDAKNDTQSHEFYKGQKQGWEPLGVDNNAEYQYFGNVIVFKITGTYKAVQPIRHNDIPNIEAYKTSNWESGCGMEYWNIKGMGKYQFVVKNCEKNMNKIYRITNF